jgi:6-phosphogluconolactonase
MNLRPFQSWFALVLISFQFSGPCTAAAAQSDQFLVYYGTYTGPKSKGIYVSKLDARTGKLSAPELAAEIVSPSFVAIHPNHKFLYAVNEVNSFSGQSGGAVSSFAIDAKTGKLTLLNQQSSGGSGPCHLVVDNAGKNVLVANYNGGSTCVLPVEKDGRLAKSSAFIQHQGSSVNRPRQDAPHAHGAYLDASNRFAFVPDLGLDKVLIFKFDSAQGSLIPNDPASASVQPGSGPRHFAFERNGRFAYVINEITCTVTAFAYDRERGQLKEFQTISSLPADESVKGGYSTAELEAHPSGKFLYGSNRGHNTIAVYSIDPSSGKLSLAQHQSTQGKTPRSFGIDPTGAYFLAANQGSDNVVVFKIDANTGKLTATGQTVEVGAPVCVKFVPLP